MAYFVKNNLTHYQEKIKKLKMISLMREIEDIGKIYNFE